VPVQGLPGHTRPLGQQRVRQPGRPDLCYPDICGPRLIARSELAALMADGRPKVPIWRSYPLAQAAQAHADIEARRNHGKIVLLP
jgi:hypothetical protein